MKSALAILEPALLGNQQREVTGRVVLYTVSRDLNEIGMTLVDTMFAANRFQFTEPGIDPPTKANINAIKESKAEIVGMAALIKTTMREQQTINDALKQDGVSDQVKVMVRGAPVTQRWAGRIGADAFAEDAIEAVKKAKELLGIV